VLPGEKLVVQLVREGRGADQALAYLDDGTMIVVHRARQLIGRSMEVVISSVLQTAAGRMAFAELTGADNGNSVSSPDKAAPELAQGK
jgi:uncharacterized protein YacL